MAASEDTAMSETITEDNTAQFEMLEDEVIHGLHPEYANFTKWAQHEAQEEAREVESDRDFPCGHDTDDHPRPKFMTSTPLEGSSPFHFNDIDSLECISARGAPVPPIRKNLPVVHEENERPVEQAEMPKEHRTEPVQAENPKERRVEPVIPLLNQLRALIQHFDVEAISIRKRQEQYFRQMNLELQEDRNMFNEEVRARENAFRQREKELTEREKRVAKNESERLYSMKLRLKDEIDLKNQKQAEIYKLEEEKAALEGENRALKEVAKRRIRKLIAEKKAEERQRVLEVKPNPKNKSYTEKREPARYEQSSTSPNDVESRSSSRVGDQPRDLRNLRLQNLDYTKPGGDLNEHEATASSFALPPSPTGTVIPKPGGPLTPQTLHDEILSCGCLTLCDHNGIVREWTHCEEAFSVKWSEDGSHIQLNSPQSVRVTFAQDEKIYVVSPPSHSSAECPGMVIDKWNRVQYGMFSTKGERGLFRKRAVTGNEYVKYQEDDSLGCSVGDLLIRRFVDKATKIVITGVNMNFIHRPGRLFRMSHVDKESNIKIPCLYIDL